MRSIDRLLQDKKKEQAARPSGAEDGPDQVDITMEKPARKSLDTARSVFDDGLEKRFGGINTAPSVFDKGAVFKTGQKK